MPFADWLPGWLRPRRRSVKHSAPLSDRLRARPAVHPLEGRLVPATIGINAYADQNGNGVQDAGDGPVANVGVSITQPSGTVVTGTTGADGTVGLTVSGSGSSSYSVSVSYTPPAGYAIETPAGGEQTIDIPDESAEIGVGVGLTSGSGRQRERVRVGEWLGQRVGQWLGLGERVRKRVGQRQ